MWESDLNVKLDMWSVFVFGLVCFPLCSSVRMNERLCLAFGLSFGCVVFLDSVTLVPLFFVVLRVRPLLLRAILVCSLLFARFVAGICLQWRNVSKLEHIYCSPPCSY